MRIPCCTILAHRIVRDRGGRVAGDQLIPSSPLPSERLPTIVARASVTAMPWRPFWRMVFCVTVASEPPRPTAHYRSLSARRFSVITIPVELTPMLMPSKLCPVMWLLRMVMAVPSWSSMPWTPRVITKPSMTRSRLNVGLEHRGRQPRINHHGALAVQRQPRQPTEIEGKDLLRGQSASRCRPAPARCAPAAGGPCAGPAAPR